MYCQLKVYDWVFLVGFGCWGVLNTKAGFKAGIILEKLGETGLITIAELARRLNFAADETALAAGWLARENKIYIERRNGLVYIRKE